MAAKQFQSFEIRRFGSPLTKHLREIEQVHVILQYEISETIDRQASVVQFIQERMTFDRAPNGFGAPPQLKTEFLRHKPALAEYSYQEKAESPWALN
jgi:hypothetical protein